MRSKMSIRTQNEILKGPNCGSLFKWVVCKENCEKYCWFWFESDHHFGYHFSRQRAVSILKYDSMRFSRRWIRCKCIWWKFSKVRSLPNLRYKVAGKLTFEKKISVAWEWCARRWWWKFSIVSLLLKFLYTTTIELTVAKFYQEYAPPCASNIKQVKILKNQLDTQYVLKNFCRADFWDFLPDAHASDEHLAQHQI